MRVCFVTGRWLSGNRKNSKSAAFAISPLFFRQPETRFMRDTEIKSTTRGPTERWEFPSAGFSPSTIKGNWRMIWARPSNLREIFLLYFVYLFKKNNFNFFKFYANINIIISIWVIAFLGHFKVQYCICMCNNFMFNVFKQVFWFRYENLSEVVDQVFPPLSAKDELDAKTHVGNFPAPDEYSTFTYWREPLPDVTMDIPD